MRTNIFRVKIRTARKIEKVREQESKESEGGFKIPISQTTNKRTGKKKEKREEKKSNKDQNATEPK